MFKPYHISITECNLQRTTTRIFLLPNCGSFLSLEQELLKNQIVIFPCNYLAFHEIGYREGYDQASLVDNDLPFQY
jgi:hypothetical protein